MTSKLFFNLSRTVFVERMMHPRRPRGRIVGARESLNGWENKAQKKSKERPEEALGTMGAFHLGKKPGNFGGSKSGISDW